MFSGAHFEFDNLWSYDQALNEEINYILEEEYNNTLN